jgi:hypothetical protein
MTRSDMIFVQNFIFLKISLLSRSRTRSRLGCYQSRLGKPRFRNDRDPESIESNKLLIKVRLACQTFSNLILLQYNIYFFYIYRKSGYYGTNFDFDLDCGSMSFLNVLLQRRDWLILIWSSFSSFIVCPYFLSTLLFNPKHLKFLGFRFCG